MPPVLGWYERILEQNIVTPNGVDGSIKTLKLTVLGANTTITVSETIT